MFALLPQLALVPVIEAVATATAATGHAVAGATGPVILEREEKAVRALQMQLKAESSYRGLDDVHVCAGLEPVVCAPLEGLALQTDGAALAGGGIVQLEGVGLLLE